MINIFSSQPSTIKNADKKTLLEKVPQPIEFDVYGTDSCGNVSTEKIMCHACHKKFSTKNSLTRHEEHSPVCLKWLSQEPQDSLCHSLNLFGIIEDAKKNSISMDDTNTCLHCNSSFSNIGNLHKHYKTATTCNRLAIKSFINRIKLLDATT
jgi:hypothetical protein